MLNKFSKKSILIDYSQNKRKQTKTIYNVIQGKTTTGNK